MGEPTAHRFFLSSYHAWLLGNHRACGPSGCGNLGRAAAMASSGDVACGGSRGSSAQPATQGAFRSAPALLRASSGARGLLQLPERPRNDVFDLLRDAGLLLRAGPTNLAG